MNRTFVLSILFVLALLPGSLPAQSVSVTRFRDTDGSIVDTSAVKPLPVDVTGGITIASATFSASGAMEVYDTRLPVGVTVLATASTVVSTIPIVSGASEILISVIPTDKTIWITLGTTATPAANIGHPVRSSVSIGRLNASEVIKVYAAEDVAIMHTQR